MGFGETSLGESTASRRPDGREREERGRTREKLVSGVSEALTEETGRQEGYGSLDGSQFPRSVEFVVDRIPLGPRFAVGEDFVFFPSQVSNLGSISTMDEEALKKNTDCVYFLASPLTCKKGNDCEFRHSESARVNPRDCRYWLAGNCLNWDCPFRHPPLEGRPVAAATAAPIPGVGNRRIPCYFFAQGYCAKGDKCTFMHGTPSLGSKSSAPQRSARTVPASGTEQNEKESVPSANGAAAKPHTEVTETEAPSESRPAHVGDVGDVQSSPRKEIRTYSSTGANQNGGARGRTEGPAPASGHVGGGRLRLRQIQPGDDRVQNGMESDEWWEESSPGFDVLVDDGPEQSRYPDDPDFQSAGEAGLESSKGKSGTRGRGRSMRMADDIEQYDYDYAHAYDHANYEGVTSYEHGGYDYGVHEQQGGYDPSSAYERMGHQRSGGYSERGGAEDMLARERLGLPVEVDGRSGGGSNDHRSRLGSVKRRRPDGGQQHSAENHSRRQRTEMPMDEYQQHQRQQEDQQKQHELQLRYQLFVQHRIRNHNSNDNSGRRPHEKITVEPSGVARRAPQDIGTEGIPLSERAQIKPGSKGWSGVENFRSGTKESENSRMSKVGESLGEPESRMYIDSEGNRKTEKEIRKEPSTFAGPKTLAQIKAEKAKGTSEDVSKVKEASNGSKVPLQVSGIAKGATGRGQHQSPAGFSVDALSGDTSSVEERKMRLDTVLTYESKRPAPFEGPKSLSAILKEKRKVEAVSDTKLEETGRDHLQRISPAGSSMVTATGVETGLSVESTIQEVDTGLGTDLGADVEDGELLSDEDETLKSRTGMDEEGRHSFSMDREADEPQVTSPRDNQWEREAAQALQTIDGVEEEDIIEGPVQGSDYGDVQDYEEEVRESDIEHVEDEVGFVGLDDEEEDDFAKKLGGFFS